MAADCIGLPGLGTTSRGRCTKDGAELFCSDRCPLLCFHLRDAADDARVRDSRLDRWVT